MPGAVDAPDTSDCVSLRVLRVSMADRVEVGAASTDLIGKGERKHQWGKKTTDIHWVHTTLSEVGYW